MFITFEGGEGAGKTTQIELLALHLKDSGKKVFVTRDPGGTIISEKVREILKSKDSGGMFCETEILLFLAARSQMVREVIRPRLDEGYIVISDRFSDSTTAYQGHGDVCNADFLKKLLDFSAGGLVPDFTLLLQIDPKVGLLRKSGQSELDRMELKGLEFHKRVFEMYAKEAAKNPERIFTIDAALTASEIHDEIRRIIYG